MLASDVLTPGFMNAGPEHWRALAPLLRAIEADWSTLCRYVRP